MQQRFVHLRLHTEYSLKDSIVRLKNLLQQLPKCEMNAVAVTDFCNLFAALKLYVMAMKAGIKPIIGCDIPYYHPEAPETIFSMILLCQNELGYRNLTQLVSKAYLEGQQVHGLAVSSDWIRVHKEGLIALSGGPMGDVGQAILENNEEKATSRLSFWKAVFPNRYYIEIQRTNRNHEALYNEAILKLATHHNLPLVATNDVCFMHEEDFEAHEARVCIHQGLTLSDPKRARTYSTKQYLKTADEMCALFYDLPSAVQNTVEIAKRCTLKLDLGQNFLPKFPIPKDSTVENYLESMAKIGLNKRLKQLFKQLDETEFNLNRKQYDTRLETEISVINAMGFAGYFLIVADFIQWAKNNQVPVGPGRGSGAGSLVAYALGITDLDPLEYDLLFERFLNPERVSMPDFDIDFCMAGRDRVIEYVTEKYGRESVSQIITFGTMAAKAVVRDVGRVLAHPYSFVDEIAKLIPFEIGMTLKQALQDVTELRERYTEEEEVKELIDLALKLEGITRNAGKHAGGVVIAPLETD